MRGNKGKIFTGARMQRWRPSRSEVYRERSSSNPSQLVKELLENTDSLIEANRGPKPFNAQNDRDPMYPKIAKFNVKLDWLKEP